MQTGRHRIAKHPSHFCAPRSSSCPVLKVDAQLLAPGARVTTTSRRCRSCSTVHKMNCRQVLNKLSGDSQLFSAPCVLPSSPMLIRPLLADEYQDSTKYGMSYSAPLHYCMDTTPQINKALQGFLLVPLNQLLAVLRPRCRCSAGCVWGIFDGSSARRWSPQFSHVPSALRS